MNEEPVAPSKDQMGISPVTVTIIVLVFVGVLGLLAVYVSNVNQQRNQNLTVAEVQNAVPLESMQASTGELIIEDIQIGTGEATKAGDTITVHYTGTLLDGTKFDSSVDRGTPYTFELGAGTVIAGWDQGLVGMQIGGKRKLTIPSHLAYGDRAAGALIPANSTLVFEVELLEIASEVSNQE